MSFDLVAKNLVSTSTPRHKTKGEENLEKANSLIALADAGFSPTDLFDKLSALYDITEDDSVKKQILDMVIKMHGLYKDEERKAAPVITFNFNGDPLRMQAMLCPPLSPPSPKGGEDPALLGA